MLINTSTTAATGGSAADMPDIPERARIIAFIGIVRSTVTRIPITPAVNPRITASALNTREISRFDAPIERRIPISFVRSSTEMYVIIPIIIEDTTSDIATNAISTYDIAFIMVVTDDIISAT